MTLACADVPITGSTYCGPAAMSQMRVSGAATAAPGARAAAVTANAIHIAIPSRLKAIVQGLLSVEGATCAARAPGGEVAPRIASLATGVNGLSAATACPLAAGWTRGAAWARIGPEANPPARGVVQ